jgi:predicted TIM-barrel fold metal-dependent hydrolase
VIDSHVHVWTLEPERFPWQQTLAHVPIPTEPATADFLLRLMNETGVERAVLVQPSVYGWDNSYLCDCVEREPERFVGVCLVEPQSERAAADLRHWCNERGCRGVRINTIGAEDASWVLDRAREPLWRTAQELEVSVSFQMRPTQAADVTELAERYPGLRVVADYLGHDAFRDSSGLAALEQLATRSNIWLKVIASGPDSLEPYPFADLWPLYEQAVASFGPKRLVFGTDFPHVLKSCTYEQAIGWLDELPFLDEASRTALATTNATVLWGAPTIVGGSDEA